MKSSAQLDREIAEALATKPRAKGYRAHAVVADAEDVDDDEIFEVANDAFKEGDLRRAEGLVGQMRDPSIARCVKKTTHITPKSFFAPRTRSKRTLYKLYRPLFDSSGTEHWWVMATAAAYNPDVTLLYPATEDGKVIEYVAIIGLAEVNHDAVMKHQGFRVVECEGKPRKPRASHATKRISGPRIFSARRSHATTSAGKVILANRIKTSASFGEPRHYATLIDQVTGQTVYKSAVKQASHEAAALAETFAKRRHLEIVGRV